jgi:hypothetical protein
MGLFVFLGLVTLTLLALIIFGTGLLSSRTDGESVGRVEDPTVEGAPEIMIRRATRTSQRLTCRTIRRCP